MEQKSSALDTIKLLFALSIVIAGSVAFHIYKKEELLMSVVGILVVIGMAIGISMTTFKGKQAWGFIKDARIEIKKVVWPTRQETMQTTLVVFVMVFIVGLILWLMDTLLRWGIGKFTGLGD